MNLNNWENSKEQIDEGEKAILEDDISFSIDSLTDALPISW